MIRVSRLVRNQKGLSLVELVVAAGLTSLVIGLSVVPMVQMKNLEKRVEFQTSLDTVHQLSLQKARNADYLKTYLGIAPGNAAEKCFGGRGTSCGEFSKGVQPGLGGTSTPLLTETFTQAGGYAARSDTYVWVTCGATKCGSVNVQVTTTQTAGSTGDGWVGRNLNAQFAIPPSALATRQEIRFPCGSSVVSGVDFNTLTASCESATGANTCNGIATAGPMVTFGGTTGAANCQTTEMLTCPKGMSTYGMINGQAVCATMMSCTDPLSGACATPTPVPTVAPTAPPTSTATPTPPGPPTTPTPAAGYCLYQCINNFVQDVDGRLEIGETSPESCKITMAMLTKFSMGCNGYDGATCSLTNPTGPISQAVCAGVVVIPTPTPTPVPVACPMPPKFFGGGGGCWSYTGGGAPRSVGTVVSLVLTGVGCPGGPMGGSSCNFTGTCQVDGTWLEVDDCTGSEPPPSIWWKYKTLGPGSCGNAQQFTDLDACHAAIAASGCPTCTCTDADTYYANCF